MDKSNNNIFQAVEVESVKDTNQQQNELDIIENEIQNYQDEIQLEKQKQAKFQQQIKLLISNTKHISDQELTLNKDPLWLTDLNKKLQHHQKIQQILKLQIQKVEIELSNSQENKADSQGDDDQDKEALLKTLKEDLVNIDNELDQLRSQIKP
ncbi:hypothetical protein BJ944DRAFT_270287 [Cunninghamella echinulata]|nr:hypothetical protein BJ944DRAFT_270287 [Cunninghamella echinulata]